MLSSRILPSTLYRQPPRSARPRNPGVSRARIENLGSSKRLTNADSRGSYGSAGNREYSAGFSRSRPGITFEPESTIKKKQSDSDRLPFSALPGQHPERNNLNYDPRAITPLAPKINPPALAQTTPHFIANRPPKFPKSDGRQPPPDRSPLSSRRGGSVAGILQTKIERRAPA